MAEIPPAIASVTLAYPLAFRGWRFAVLLRFRRLPFSLRPVGSHSLGLRFTPGGTEATALRSGSCGSAHHGGQRILRRSAPAFYRHSQSFYCTIQLVALRNQECQDLFCVHLRE